MKNEILAIAAVGLLAGPMAANAIIIDGTWDFSGGPFTGTFSISGLDTSASVFDVTTGFSFTSNFATVAGFLNGYTYFAAFDRLLIGSTYDGVQTLQGYPGVNDFTLAILNFSTVPTFESLYYCPVGQPSTAGCPYSRTGSITARTVPEPTVPEPGALALFGLGLAGLGFSRRLKSA